MGPLTAFDLGLPTSEMGEFVAGSMPASSQRGPTPSPWLTAILATATFIWCAMFRLPGMTSRMTISRTLVYGAVGRVGGTISAEHGIGLLKKPYLAFSRTSVEIALMESIKTML